jgi:hypothetical protein
VVRERLRGKERRVEFGFGVRVGVCREEGWGERSQGHEDQDGFEFEFGVECGFELKFGFERRDWGFVE